MKLDLKELHALVELLDIAASFDDEALEGLQMSQDEVSKLYYKMQQKEFACMGYTDEE